MNSCPHLAAPTVTVRRSRVTSISSITYQVWQEVRQSDMGSMRESRPYGARERGLRLIATSPHRLHAPPPRTDSMHRYHAPPSLIAAWPRGLISSSRPSAHRRVAGTRPQAALWPSPSASLSPGPPAPRPPAAPTPIRWRAPAFRIRGPSRGLGRRLPRRARAASGRTPRHSRYLVRSRRRL